VNFLWRREMDAACYRALALALDLQLPVALQDALLALERRAMGAEDLAAHAAMGRVAHNPNLEDIAALENWTWSDAARNAEESFYAIYTRAQLLAERVRSLEDGDRRPRAADDEGPPRRRARRE
jgi:hypothetical protein